jgi:hypothetical protein
VAVADNTKEAQLVMVLLVVLVVALVMALIVMPIQVALAQLGKDLKVAIKPLQVLHRLVAEVAREPPPQTTLAVVTHLRLVVLAFLHP